VATFSGLRIRCFLAHGASVGAVSLHPNSGFQPQLLHQPLNDFVIHLLAETAQGGGNASVPIATMVFAVDRLYTSF